MEKILMICVLASLMILLSIDVLTEGSKDVQCSRNDSTSLIRFAVTSRANDSGHRIVLVDLENQAHLPVFPGDELALGVTHQRSLTCNLETVQLKTVISVYGGKATSRKDYEYFPGLGYYKLHTIGKTWDDARITCYNEEAHLMVINSDAEAQVVREFFSRNPNFQDVYFTHYVFIGYHDKFSEGHFVVITGEPLAGSGYARWAPGQPDGGTKQNFGGVDKDGLLHDIVDSEKYGFICEKDIYI